MNTLIEKMPKNKAKILKGTFAHALLEKKAEGEAIGVAKGEAKVAQTKKEFVISLFEKFPNMVDAEIADLAKVDEASVRKLRLEVKAKK